MAPPLRQKKHLQRNCLAVVGDRKADKLTEGRKEAMVPKWEAIFEKLAAQKQTLVASLGCAESPPKMVRLGMRDSVN